MQYTDRKSIVNINRDDASGFRLDTMTTCKQHATPVVSGQCVTTQTDYVNHYPSTLQTTCYNFTGTDNTPEMCAGIVKAATLHHKNPMQHACDLAMLEEKVHLCFV